MEQRAFTMRQATRQIVVLLMLMLLICVACRLAVRSTYTAYVQIPPNMGPIQPTDIRFSEEVPGIIARGEPVIVGDFVRIPIRPEKPGTAFMDVHFGDREEAYGCCFDVGRFNTIYDHSTGGFTGDSIVLVAVTVFWLLTAAIMFRVFRQSRGPAFYAYGTIYAAGFSIFSLVTGLTMLNLSIQHFTNRAEFIMLDVYASLSGAGFQFMIVTLPFLVIFAIAISVSNIALIRHEGKSLKNVLGIIVGLLLLAGEALGIFMLMRNFSGSAMELRIQNTLQNVYATAFAYFECMLIGAIICGIKAAKHVPSMDRDYILILGCKFRKDGSLTPLLRGRVDRAVDFWHRQKDATGREAVLMPSGGQGSDEPISEAEAMRRYLLSQGIPEQAIQAEDRSRNTYQNMQFSRALIERENPGAKVAYATTNYHVFRSGVWASLAGLEAEGMGSRTKWWYWPNAFMRECVGLMMNRIPQEIALLAIFTVFFGVMSMALW